MAWHNGKRTVRCRRCYGVGHNMRNCPTLSAEQKAAYTTGDKARQCSYCAMKGHNKTSCPKRKTDIQEYANVNAKYRKEMLDIMVSSKIGIGALVKARCRAVEDGDPDKLYMVKNILWNDFQEKNSTARIFECQPLDNDFTFYMNMVANSRMYYAWNTPVVVGGVNPESIKDSVPPDWLNGSSGIERYFK